MSNELVLAMIDALRMASADADTRVIILAGAGPGFCAGSDLGGLARMDAAGRETFEAESGRLARLLGTLPQPVIAAVHGFAIGGGLTLAAACDIVVCEATAKWSLPEVPIGLFPAWGLAAVTARIGAPAARRLAWGIETLSGEAAHHLGLVDFIAADPSEKATELADALAALPTLQTKFVKEYFTPAGEAAADLTANRLFMHATGTPEAQASFEKFGKK